MNIITKLTVILRKASMKIRRNIIKYSGLKLTENYFLDSPYTSRNEKVTRLEVYAQPETVKMPSLFDENDQITFSFQKRYIYEIPNATIDPMTGMIYDEDGKFIAESSTWDYQRLLAETPRPYIMPPSSLLKGEYVFLPSTPTYYHWLIEDLPVFIGAINNNPQANIITGTHEFPPIKIFIDKYFKGKVQKVTLPIRVEKLIMAGKIAGLGNPVPPHNTAHPQDLRVLKNWFSEYLPKNTDNQKQVMIYLSRSRWNRAIQGEIELEKKLEQLGFVIFHGDISLFEQIKLFSKAKVIVGASGAALSNLVWCKKGTQVIQIHPARVYYRFYFNISSMLGLQYHFVEAPDKNWSKQDIDDLLSKITQTYQ